MAASPFFAEAAIPKGRLSDYFFGREALVAQLSARLDQKAPSRSLLVGPPKSGRSSLAVAVAEAARGTVQPLALSVRRLLPASASALVAQLLALAGEATGGARWRELARRLSINPQRLALEVALEAADELSRTVPRPLLILEDLEEADEATARLIEALLLGTKAHALATTTREPAGPLAFLGSFKTSRLAPLGRRASLDFARSRLASAGIAPTDDALEGLITYSQGDPHSLQLLGLRLYEAALLQGNRAADGDTFSAALYAALDSLPLHLTAPYHELPPRMREVFVALCTLPVPSVTAIGSLVGMDPGNVTVILSRLAQRGLVTKLGRGAWVPAHRLLAEYVRRDYSAPAWS